MAAIIPQGGDIEMQALPITTVTGTETPAGSSPAVAEKHKSTTGVKSDVGAVNVAATLTPEQLAEARVKSVILFLCCIAQFMVILDVSVVNVALPSIKTDLGFLNDSDLQWIVTSYSVAYGGLLLVGGKIGDYFGRRLAFAFGVVMFTAASLLGGLSTTQTWIIAARAVQGVGASILSPATLTILTVTFTDPKEKAKAFGAWSGVASAGGATGALIGGLLVQYINWRWILFINVPIGVILFILTVAYMKESVADTSNLKIDYLGAVFITGGLVALVYGISRAAIVYWGSWDTFYAMLVAFILLVLFVITELLVPQPLIPFSLFRNRNVLGANMVIFIVGSAMFSNFFFLTLWLQTVTGLSAINTGLAFLPQSFALGFGAVMSAKFSQIYGPRHFIQIGCLVSAGGLFWLSYIKPTDTYATGACAPSILTGAGVGMTFAPITFLATAGLDRKFAGLASGLINCSRQIGASIFLAVFSTLVDQLVSSDIKSGLSALTGPPSDNIINQITHDSMSDGFAHGFLYASIAMVCAFVISFVIPLSVPAPVNGEADNAPVAAE